MPKLRNDGVNNVNDEILEDLEEEVQEDLEEEQKKKDDVNEDILEDLEEDLTEEQKKKDEERKKLMDLIDDDGNLKESKFDSWVDSMKPSSLKTEGVAIIFTLLVYLILKTISTIRNAYRGHITKDLRDEIREKKQKEAKQKAEEKKDDKVDKAEKSKEDAKKVKEEIEKNKEIEASEDTKENSRKNSREISRENSREISPTRQNSNQSSNQNDNALADELANVRKLIDSMGETLRSMNNAGQAMSQNVNQGRFNNQGQNVNQSQFTNQAFGQGAANQNVAVMQALASLNAQLTVLRNEINNIRNQTNAGEAEMQQSRRQRLGAQAQSQQRRTQQRQNRSQAEAVGYDELESVDNDRIEFEETESLDNDRPEGFREVRIEDEAPEYDSNHAEMEDEEEKEGFLSDEDRTDDEYEIGSEAKGGLLSGQDEDEPKNETEIKGSARPAQNEAEEEAEEGFQKMPIGEEEKREEDFLAEEADEEFERMPIVEEEKKEEDFVGEATEDGFQKVPVAEEEEGFQKMPVGEEEKREEDFFAEEAEEGFQKMPIGEEEAEVEDGFQKMPIINEEGLADLEDELEKGELLNGKAPVEANQAKNNDRKTENKDSKSGRTIDDIVEERRNRRADERARKEGFQDMPIVGEENDLSNWENMENPIKEREVGDYVVVDNETSEYEKVGNQDLDDNGISPDWVNVESPFKMREEGEFVVVDNENAPAKKKSSGKANELVDEFEVIEKPDPELDARPVEDIRKEAEDLERTANKLDGDIQKAETKENELKTASDALKEENKNIQKDLDNVIDSMESYANRIEKNVKTLNKLEKSRNDVIKRMEASYLQMQVESDQARNEIKKSMKRVELEAINNDPNYQPLENVNLNEETYTNIGLIVTGVKKFNNTPLLNLSEDLENKVNAFNSAVNRFKEAKQLKNDKLNPLQIRELGIASRALRKKLKEDYPNINDWTHNRRGNNVHVALGHLYTLTGTVNDTITRDVTEKAKAVMDARNNAGKSDKLKAVDLVNLLGIKSKLDTIYGLDAGKMADSLSKDYKDEIAKLPKAAQNLYKAVDKLYEKLDDDEVKGMLEKEYVSLYDKASKMIEESKKVKNPSQQMQGLIQELSTYKTSLEANNCITHLKKIESFEATRSADRKELEKLREMMNATEKENANLENLINKGRDKIQEKSIEKAHSDKQIRDKDALLRNARKNKETLKNDREEMMKQAGRRKKNLEKRKPKQAAM